MRFKYIFFTLFCAFLYTITSVLSCGSSYNRDNDVKMGRVKPTINNFYKYASGLELDEALNNKKAKLKNKLRNRQLENETRLDMMVIQEFKLDILMCHINRCMLSQCHKNKNFEEKFQDCRKLVTHNWMVKHVDLFTNDLDFIDYDECDGFKKPFRAIEIEELLFS